MEGTLLAFEVNQGLLLQVRLNNRAVHFLVITSWSQRGSAQIWNRPFFDFFVIINRARQPAHFYALDPLRGNVCHMKETFMMRFVLNAFFSSNIVFYMSLLVRCIPDLFIYGAIYLFKFGFSEAFPSRQGVVATLRIFLWIRRAILWRHSGMKKANTFLQLAGSDQHRSQTCRNLTSLTDYSV